MTIFNRKIRFQFFFCLSIICLAIRPSFAATEEEFEKFRRAMIERECWFRNNEEGKQLQSELGMTNSKFSEVMLRLALKGEFICPGGCKLLHQDCPNEE